MKTYALLILSLIMTGCVAVSGNLEEKIDLITDQPYFEIGLEVSYPAKKFMKPEEWIEFHQLPPHHRTQMYEYYKEREENEENMARIIEDCILQFTFDC